MHPWPVRRPPERAPVAAARAAVDPADLEALAVAKATGVDAVVFDRGGNRYHGRVAAIADGAREGGLTL